MEAPCEACGAVTIQSWRHGQEVIEQRTQISAIAANGVYSLSKHAGVSVIFASANHLRGSCHATPSCKNTLVTTFAIPDVWWQDACRTSNGYFGSDEVSDERGRQTGIVTWYRAIVKQLTQTYHWPKFNVVSRWYKATSHTVILLFDAPQELSSTWASALIHKVTRAELQDPFWIYPRLLNQIVQLQNKSVWMCRDIVRGLEKDRNTVNGDRLDYYYLHSTARHIIHITETLEVSIDIVEDIKRHYELYQLRLSTGDDQNGRARHSFDREMLFHRTMLVSLKKRSDSNSLRLQNEINLSFNIVSQQQSKASVDVGKAAKQDGEAMRAIAAVTLVFLPSTFVSAIFSTSFFNYDQQSGRWAVSGKFWIYWIVAIPLTLLSMLAWYLWTKMIERKEQRAEKMAKQLLSLK